MKEFATAARVVENEDHEDRYPHEFKLDGVVCRARDPKDGQVGVLMAMTGRHSSTEEAIAGVINFFVSVLDPDSHSFVVSKLLDPDDEFGLEPPDDNPEAASVQGILEYLMEQWSGRPTKSSSASSGSQKRGGRRSTPSTPQLT